MDINEQKIGLEENQKNLLYFITQVISDKEQEDFDITKVNLCSQFYTFVPGYITVGFMLIIANEAYWRGHKDYFENKNVTDYECVSQLRISKSQGGKALFLKYKHNLINEKIKFKKNKLVSLDDTDYVNAINFPYLNSAIEKLYSNAIDGQITSEVVNQTLQQIKAEDILNNDENVNKRMIESNIVDSLNGRRI